MQSDDDASDYMPEITCVVICKDEPSLDETLHLLQREVDALRGASGVESEILVIDASSFRLDAIRLRHPGVRWEDFAAPEGVSTSIPHQRNHAVECARGDIIVFTDCGCSPIVGWLGMLTAPILSGREAMVCGRAVSSEKSDPYDRDRSAPGREYLSECSTINLALRRAVFDDIGPFDESFAYGSDTDFSWRAIHAGYRIRYEPSAVISVSWGSRRRQLRRSYVYGKARARLLYKHILSDAPQSIRKRKVCEADLVPIVYSLYILGLPVALRRRGYVLLLVIPMIRSRGHAPIASLVDHLMLGLGVIVGWGDLVIENVR